jgi:hypothetical protein
MTKLNYDYFVWVDADTVFRRKPLDVLGCLGASPIHAPLESNLAELAEDIPWKGFSLFEARDALMHEGIANDPYSNDAAFWIVHRDAIEHVYDLAVGFYHKNREAGVRLHAATALGYAMQILCGDPSRHLRERNGGLWGPQSLPEGPAIAHLQVVSQPRNRCDDRSEHVLAPIKCDPGSLHDLHKTP